MYEEFKGFKIPRPSAVNTCESFESVLSQTVDKFNAGAERGCCARVRCGGLGCYECLFGWNADNCDEVIQAFAEYARSKGYKITREGLTIATNSMPELVPGMVIKTTDNSYYLYIGPDRLKALKMAGCDSGADFSVTGSCSAEINDERIASIFYWDDERAPSKLGKGLSSFNVLAVLRGAIAKDGYIREWKRQSPVKMTVSEISEKLGYDVEIIADKK